MMPGTIEKNSCSIPGKRLLTTISLPISSRLSRCVDTKEGLILVISEQWCHVACRYVGDFKPQCCRKVSGIGEKIRLIYVSTDTIETCTLGYLAISKTYSCTNRAVLTAAAFIVSRKVIKRPMTNQTIF